MVFEERIDVHSELYDVRTAAIKTLKIKDLNKKKTKPGSTPLNALLKNDFTVFQSMKALLSLAK
jgi:Fe-S cluster assembly protein SufD